MKNHGLIIFIGLILTILFLLALFTDILSQDLLNKNEGGWSNLESGLATVLAAFGIVTIITNYYRKDVRKNTELIHKIELQLTEEREITRGLIREINELSKQCEITNLQLSKYIFNLSKN